MIGRRIVGRSGLQVSALSLGAMTFATRGSYAEIAASESEMDRIVGTALDLGIDTFDTANVYGEGGSEEILGRLLGPRRADVVLCTKIRFPSCNAEPGIAPRSTGYGLSRRAIVAGVEASLRRLGTDHIDLLQFHMQDRATPIEESLRAVDDLITVGKVRYLGLCNYTGYRLIEALWAADRRSLAAPVSLQAPWSLTNRDVERELVPAAAQFGLGIFAYSPLARGLLTGKYAQGADPPLGTRLTAWRDELPPAGDRSWPIVEAVREIAERHGTQPGPVALAWLLRRRTLATVVIGVRTADQLRENVAATDLSLPPADLALLDRVSETDPGYPYAFIRRFEPW